MTEQDSDYALLTEIAVAYYDQEQTQEEIAKRFGISRIKVGRLLKKARHEGIVEISVKYHPVFSSQIEQQFISHFGIKRALIALDHHDEDEQRQQVAALVSNYLAGILKSDMTVTVGQGQPRGDFSGAQLSLYLRYRRHQARQPADRCRSHQSKPGA